MLNTQKLLYVLPDLAYIAELLPDKKPHTFAIQSFKQINGEFLNEKEFLAANVVKLVNKLEEGEDYFLILPDFLFTNTIVSVKETSDAKIKDALAADTLPKLGLKDDTHLIETVVLNQLKGTTRVQLSAIEKSILSIFKVAIAEKDIKIAGVCPLSWAVKSLISLEPSISILQMGSNLFAAQQYIGVDQATNASVDDPDKIIETVKTLKGAEASIQTVYLCTNGMVEDKLKDGLSKILPLQQMATKDSANKIPSYVSEIITASMKTLNVPDYSVPTFKLAKATAEEKEQFANILTATPAATDEEEDTEATELPKPKTIPGSDTTEDKVEESEAESAVAEETKPTTNPAAETPDIDNLKETAANEEPLPDIEDVKEDDDKQAETPAPSILDSAATGTVAAGVVAGATVTGATPSPVVAAPTVDAGDMTADSTPETSTEVTPETPETGPAATVEPTTEATDQSTTNQVETTQTESDTMQTTEAKPEEAEATTVSPEAVPPTVVGAAQVATPATDATAQSDSDIDLSQFTQNGETVVQSNATDKPVIKNKSGVKNMMKMILITTGVFILTVAIGIGVGLAILKYTGSNKASDTPTVEVEEPTPSPEATPTPEPTPEASASAEIDKSELKVLVVNATTKAGYAGQIATKLKSADFENVTGANAKGEYEDEGTYVYLKESNDSLVDELSDASGLALTESDDAKTEDASGQYDAVIVLAE